MRSRIVTLACVVAVLVEVSPAYGQEAALRYRWVKGDEVRYRISQQGSTTISGLPGMGEMTVDQTNVQVIRLTVEDVATDGNATLRQTFESMRMELNSPAGKVVFDSAAADKPTDPIAAAMGTTMSAMIGESITVILVPTGAVLKVEGMSRIFDKVMNTLPQDPTATQVFSQLKGSMSDDAMRSMFDQGFVIFPDHAVKAGETWTGQFQMNNPIIGRLTTAKTSTLKGVESSNGTSIARIGVMLAMKQEADAAPSGLMGMTAKLADSKSEGEILFDIAKGRVQKASFKSEMPMTMSMTSPAGAQVNAQGLVRSTMTMELVEK